MKCKDCLIWQYKHEDFNIARQWDEIARYSKSMKNMDILASFAELIPSIRAEWRQHELIKDEECTEGRCRLAIL